MKIVAEARSSYEVMDLYAAEMLEIHWQCDLAKVPREQYGEKLSAAQRVAEVSSRLGKFQ